MCGPQRIRTEGTMKTGAAIRETAHHAIGATMLFAVGLAASPPRRANRTGCSDRDAGGGRSRPRSRNLRVARHRHLGHHRSDSHRRARRVVRLLPSTCAAGATPQAVTVTGAAWQTLPYKAATVAPYPGHASCSPSPIVLAPGHGSWTLLCTGRVPCRSDPPHRARDRDPRARRSRAARPREGTCHLGNPCDHAAPLSRRGR